MDGDRTHTGIHGEMMKRNPAVAVCIINHNTCSQLRECLHSVLEESPGEIVVVDNASNDGSPDMVRAEFPSATLLVNQRNPGFGAAANQAIRNCQSEKVLILNSDTILKPGALEALGDYLEARPAVGVAGPRLLNPDGTLQTSTFYFPAPSHIFLYLFDLYPAIRFTPFIRRRSLQANMARPAGPVPWILGAAMMVRRASFESVGGFDESFFLYFEEVDLCRRLERLGWQIHYSPEAQVVHVGAASTGQRRAEARLLYFTSLARYYRKHYSPLQLVQLVLLIQSFAIFRLLQYLFQKRSVQGESERQSLDEDHRLWHRLLRGEWMRPAASSRFGSE